MIIPLVHVVRFQMAREKAIEQYIKNAAVCVDMTGACYIVFNSKLIILILDMFESANASAQVS